MIRSSHRQLRKNFIQLLIGVSLILISLIYLQAHPAEKESITSGFKIMKQKISILRHSINNGKDELLQKKYALENFAKDMNKLAETSGCISFETKKEINDIYTSLKNDTLKELSKNFSNYTQRLGNLDSMVKSQCNQ